MILLRITVNNFMLILFRLLPNCFQCYINLCFYIDLVSFLIVTKYIFIHCFHQLGIIASSVCICILKEKTVTNKKCMHAVFCIYTYVIIPNGIL